MSRPTAVIVLAAGQGTRMKSDLPKVVHPLCGLSLIGHALRAAESIDPHHVVTVVRHQRDLVAEEVLRVCPGALVADQDDIPGTGRAVQCGLDALVDAAGPLRGTVLVTYGDVPLLTGATLSALVDLHEGGGHAVTVLTTRVEDPTGYGRIIRDGLGTVTAIVEQRDATEAQRLVTEINAGIYAFDAPFLADALGRIGSDNDQGEVYLTDVLAAAAPAGRTVAALELEDSWQAQGCNDRIQLAELAAELNRRICAAHMAAGVTIEDPASTRVEVDVTIAGDTTIHPWTSLRGETSIGSWCEIGPGTTLRDVRVGSGSVLPATWGESVDLPADTMVEPFSVIGRQ